MRSFMGMSLKGKYNNGSEWTKDFLIQKNVLAQTFSYFLHGRRFQTIEEIQNNVTREMRTILGSVFQEAFQSRRNFLEQNI